ncbi:MAG: PHP domain-containing protein [Clostridia bacterium]|nr:PHP domain-containing protein [Clostridia bacterium]
MRAYYDLHIHTALSPCADDDNTPNNVVGMAKVKGLSVIGIADHNSTDNCRAAVLAGEREGILVLPGMELTTAEDIHVLCLFASLDQAEAFGAYVATKRMPIKNRPEVFGRQLVMDENDEIVREEEMLLHLATEITFSEVSELVASYGGLAIPAHIDKTANGAVAILGAIDRDMGFSVIEATRFFSDEARAFYENKGFRVVQDSDAHFLWDISEPQSYIDIDDLSGCAFLSKLKGL